MNFDRKSLVRWFKNWINVFAAFFLFLLLVHLTLFSEQPLFVDKGIGVFTG